MVSERMEGDQLSPTEFKGGGISCRQRSLGGGGRKLTANQLSMSGGGVGGNHK